MSDNEVTARNIVDKINYLTLATVDDEGYPWNAPVFGYCDSDYNCYGGSYINAQPSQNIDQNGRVYIVIYDSTVAPGTGKGVYISARAQRVENQAEIVRLPTIVNERHNYQYWPLEALSGDGSIRFYKATKQQLWMNNEEKMNEVYIDIRSEVNA